MKLAAVPCDRETAPAEQHPGQQAHLGDDWLDMRPYATAKLTEYPCMQAIEAFQKDPPTTVFLLSMRSGAVGINLTAANHVFLMEPAFNPALEDQAVGRAHRMGQTRPVTVKKFYIKVCATHC